MSCLTKHILVISIFIVVILIKIVANELLIKNRSFSVKSIVRNVLYNGDDPLLTEIQESYSFEQRRANIEFKLLTKGLEGPVESRGGPKKGIFFVDSEQKFVLLFDHDKMQCKLSHLQEIDTLFNLRMPDVENDPVAADYIVGPARLLFFIDRHRAKLKLATLESPIKIRNLKCSMYKWSYITSTLETIEFSVFFSEMSRHSMNDTLNAMPLQIVMDHAGKQIMFVDYSQIDLLPENEPRIEINHQSISRIALFDKFIIEPIAGCSKALYNGPLSSDLFADRDQNTTRFSFNANLNFKNNNNSSVGSSISLSSFVAYDAGTSMMRLDVYSPTLPSETNSGSRKHIFNFYLDRKYHIIEKVAGSNNIVDKTIGKNKDVAKQTRSTQCMVAGLSLRDRPIGKQMSIGSLLVGSSKFIYLGRAKVRGIDARVYEAFNSSIPFWLNQPVSYKDAKSGQYRFREPDIPLHLQSSNQANNRMTNRNTLVYFGEKDSDHPLLLVEIYTLNSENPNIIDDIQFLEIYDFTWNLKESPSGDKENELFALNNVCANNDGVNVQIDLVLEMNSTSVKSSLLSANDRYSLFYYSKFRNLALLGSIQRDLELPATMIHDLESRLLQSQKNKSGTTQINSYDLAMIVSFKITVHTAIIAQLTFVGFGNLNPNYQNNMAKAVARTFQSCFFLAAHRRIRVYFGFAPNKRMCLIDLNDSPPDGNLFKPAAFNMNTDGPVEIFNIDHFESLSDMDKTSNWIRGIDDDNSSANTKLFGYNLELRGLGAPGDSMVFKVKHVKQQQSTNSELSEEGELRRTSLNVLPGYGLLETISGNKLINKSPSINSQQQSSHLGNVLPKEILPMSYDQCYAACLSDFDCQSFSVCFENLDLICVTSNYSFKSPRVIKQLVALKKEKLQSKEKTRVNVTLDDDNRTVVELNSSSKCKLANKNSMDLFVQRAHRNQNLRNRRLIGVENKIDCAEMCFKQNLQVLREDSKIYANAKMKFTKSESQANYVDEKDFFASHKAIVRKLCKTFYYLNKLQLRSDYQSKAEEFKLIENKEKSSLEDISDRVKISGFCVVDDNRIGSEFFNDDLFRVDFRVEIYDFKIEFFYEKQYGFTLLNSVMETNEIEAYMLAKYKRSSATEETYKILKSLILKGSNFQDTIYEDPTNCAMACFLQNEGPWPACRSFDVVLVAPENHSSPYYKCLLNSITFNQVVESEKFELLSNETTYQLWHYEPRSGYLLDESMIEREIRLSADMHYVSFENKSGTNKFYFGFVLIFLTSSVSGILFGIWLGRKLVFLFKLKSTSENFRLEED